MKESVKQTFEQLFEQYPALETCRADIRAAFELLAGSFRDGGKLMLCGNGGSAADCEHISGELLKGFRLKRAIPAADADTLARLYGDTGKKLATMLQRGLSAIPLCSMTSLSTAVANDTDAEMVYAQQVYAAGRPGDVLLGISTSGNAANVCSAARVAKAFGMRAVGLTGADGGALHTLCDVSIRVPAREVYRIQEYHLPVYHCLGAMLELEFFGAQA